MEVRCSVLFFIRCRSFRRVEPELHQETIYVLLTY